MPADPHIASTMNDPSGKTGCAADLFLAADSLPEAARLLRGAGFFLEDVTCVDLTEGYQLLYHFNHARKPGRVRLRVLIDHARPEIPTISGLYGGANWHERECADFYGITFTGHPNPLPLPLLLDPEFAGDPPLRKKPAARRDLHQLLPGRPRLPVTVRDREFQRLVTSDQQPSL